MAKVDKKLTGNQEPKEIYPYLPFGTINNGRYIRPKDKEFGYIGLTGNDINMRQIRKNRNEVRVFGDPLANKASKIQTANMWRTGNPFDTFFERRQIPTSGLKGSNVKTTKYGRKIKGETSNNYRASFDELFWGKK